MKPEEIRISREELGLTQEALATALGVTADTVARWESGAAQPESGKMLELALDALEIRLALEDEQLLTQMREVTAKIKHYAAP